MIGVKQIVAKVREVVGSGPVALHEPSIGDAERAMVSACIAEGVVSYKYVDAFQNKIAEVCGTEQSLAVSSGTAALHLALMVAGVQPFEEVLVPAISFVATANAVCYCKATPHFVDLRSTDLGINPFKLGQYLHRITEKRPTGRYNKQTGAKVKALIAVHLLGIPSDMDAIKEVAYSFGLPVIEDAAEALGSTYKGKPCGGLGNIGAVSFNNNKIVTTNGGGALLTYDAFTQARAWSLATTARLAHPWRMDHAEVSWNYRMGNINAALGLPQLSRLPGLLAAKRKLHFAYESALGELCFTAQGEIAPNHWLNALMLHDPDASQRDTILAALHADGISCRTLFSMLNHLPMFEKCPRDNLGGAEHIWRATICLPSSASLGERL